MQYADGVLVRGTHQKRFIHEANEHRVNREKRRCSDDKQESLRPAKSSWNPHRKKSKGGLMQPKVKRFRNESKHNVLNQDKRSKILNQIKQGDV